MRFFVEIRDGFLVVVMASQINKKHTYFKLFALGKDSFVGIELRGR